MNDDIRPSSGGSNIPHMPVSEEPPRHEPTLPPNHPAAFDPSKPSKPARGPKKWFRKLKDWYHHLSKKQKIILWSVIAGLIIASGLIWWFVFRGQPEPKQEQVQTVKEEPEPPKTVAACLKGNQIPVKQKDAPVTGIMIENSTAARPQSGLYQADVVFEAIAEGGITRFLALYQSASPDYIGPARSLRPYYLDFLTPFTNAVAHAGGSAQALAEVRGGGYRDLEAFRHPGAFQRISSRAAPHNLYTNRAALVEVQNSLGPNSPCTGFASAQKENPAATPTARSIDIGISSATYNVHYDYDPNTNSYLRSMGGGPHVDERANKQISPKAAIALVMSHHYAGIYSVYGTTGSGVAYVFQDGKVVKGTWEKAGRSERFILKDAQGAELKLNPGQKWISIVSSPGAVTHQP